MNLTAAIGEPAPELQLAKWVQGEPTSLQQLLGRVVLVEVFQVNCPGCFVHALPEVLRLHHAFEHDGLTVLGVATAFEDFDRNTEANLVLLLERGELTGDPLQQLDKAGMLQAGRLDYRLEFPVALDALDAAAPDTSPGTVREFILRQVPAFDTLPDTDRATIVHRARDYLAARRLVPRTFSRYALQGTPSSILVGRDGRLRDVAFGRADHLEGVVRGLL